MQNTVKYASLAFALGRSEHPPLTPSISEAAVTCDHFGVLSVRRRYHVRETDRTACPVAEGGRERESAPESFTMSVGLLSPSCLYLLKGLCCRDRLDWT